MTKPGRLTRRADYVATAKGRRFHSESLTLQAAERAPTGATASLRGRVSASTVSRKVGNSVIRSRVKRRLREAVRRIEAATATGPDCTSTPTQDAAGLASPSSARPLPAGLPHPTYDYVIVARTPALTRPFDALVKELAADLVGVHQSRRAVRDASPGAGTGPRPFRTRGKGPTSETR